MWIQNRSIGDSADLTARPVSTCDVAAVEAGRDASQMLNWMCGFDSATVLWQVDRVGRSDLCLGSSRTDQDPWSEPAPRSGVLIG